jgi:thioredoxin-like negative regulator of GroEL
METIHSFQEFDLILDENAAVLAYFSTENCSLCKVLKPKVAKMANEAFSKLRMIYIDSDKLPQLSAQNRVFAAPTVVVFFEGCETIRKSRAFGVDELKLEIQRSYSLFYE